ncbi:hypothetical protein ANN_27521 [Periplaneta americana]|uniref:Uncharacterized protein n=1 Tax=Periplaneta americana TaxID=6978 RepID=A0ABQ8RWH0_PERAM|nr:hypothetical protein ANN_27521 [Periplaneta americana]
MHIQSRCRIIYQAIVMDVIKMEPECDPLAIQTSGIADIEDKKPSSEEVFCGLDQVKEEVKLEVTAEENEILAERPHIDVSLTCKHDPKLQEYCICPQSMPQFDPEGIPNQAPKTNKPMILNGPTSRNREGSDQETFDPSTGEPYD